MAPLTFRFITSNELTFSPDSKVMYYADSKQRKVWAWDFDAADGAIFNRRVFIELKGGEGGPDGAAVDDYGCTWLAQPPASLLVRYDPNGRADRVIEMPVSQPTAAPSAGRTWARSTSRQPNTSCRRRSFGRSRSREICLR